MTAAASWLGVGVPVSDDGVDEVDEVVGELVVVRVDDAVADVRVADVRVVGAEVVDVGAVLRDAREPAGGADGGSVGARLQDRHLVRQAGCRPGQQVTRLPFDGRPVRCGQ